MRARSLLVLTGLLATRGAWAVQSGVDFSAMDRSADPCTDFYEYSCGGWIKKNPIPPDHAMWGRDVELEEHIRQILRGILEDAGRARLNRSPNDQKIGDYYDSCMDEKSIDAKGISPIRPELDRIAALSSMRQLTGELARLHSIGVDVLFQFGSAQDYQDARRMIASVDQGGLGLPDRDYYLLDKFAGERNDYKAHVAKILVLLGDAPEAAAKEAGTVMAVETALARGSMDIVSRRVPQNVHHKTRLSELQSWSPAFAWEDYLTAVRAPSFSSLDVNSVEFMKGMQGWLDRFTMDEWKIYFRWHLVHAMVSQLPKAFVDENFDFYGRRLLGQKEIKARWKRCVQATDAALGEALGKAFVERHFPPAVKERTLDMVGGIERAMGEDIRGLAWMTPETKKKALEKLHAVTNKIGYPDHWRDYSRLDIESADALGNLQRATEFEFHRQLDKIGRLVDKNEWEITPATVNAYYDPQMNNINFPAGILQPPYFDPAADDAANYGASGFFIGHELTHAFDDEGAQYDADGNLKNWWTSADAKAFRERTRQFVEQYSSYVVVASTDPAKEVRINGELTLGENTADNGGLKLAFMAYLASRGSKKPDLIDGLDPEQRFFLGYGQSWCENMTDQVAKMLMASDPHSPDRFRLEGTVANLPAFRAAFECKGTVPEMRSVW